jgi:hypothetical protein
VPAPWGDANTPVVSRVVAAGVVAARLPDAAFFPFDRDTATGNGQVVACAQLPITPVVPFPPASCSV